MITSKKKLKVVLQTSHLRSISLILSESLDFPNDDNNETIESANFKYFENVADVSVILKRDCEQTGSTNNPIELTDENNENNSGETKIPIESISTKVAQNCITSIEQHVEYDNVQEININGQIDVSNKSIENNCAPDILNMIAKFDKISNPIFFIESTKLEQDSAIGPLQQVKYKKVIAGIETKTKENKMSLLTNQQYFCEKCGNLFETRVAYKKHERITCKVKKYSCTMCVKSFELERKLKLHKSTHYQKKKFPCDKCEKSFIRIGFLRDHLMWHTGEYPFTCETCNKKFRSKFFYKKHTKAHQSLSCSQCKKIFRTKMDIREHLKTHPKLRNFMCTKCDKQFTRKDHLEKHMLIHNNDKPFQCQECNKTFRSNHHLSEHNRRVHLRIFSCSKCNQLFQKKKERSTHFKSVHPDVRDFICSICNDTFKRKCHLQRHMMTHDDEKPLFCQHGCGKYFKRKDHFQKHIMTHMLK